MCYTTCLSYRVLLVKRLVILNVDKNHSNINDNKSLPQKVAPINISSEQKPLTSKGNSLDW